MNQNSLISYQIAFDQQPAGATRRYRNACVLEKNKTKMTSNTSPYVRLQTLGLLMVIFRGTLIRNFKKCTPKYKFVHSIIYERKCFYFDSFRCSKHEQGLKTFVCYMTNMTKKCIQSILELKADQLQPFVTLLFLLTLLDRVTSNEREAT